MAERPGMEWTMKTGIELIAEERERQVSVEGWTAKNDDAHDQGELACAAACYAIPLRQREWLHGLVAGLWPWSSEGTWKPTPSNRIGELAKAGALIAAEIDRLQRRKDLPIAKIRMTPEEKADFLAKHAVAEVGTNG